MSPAFKSMGFHPSLPDGRAMGKLVVEDHEGLDAHLSGHNREQIELRHPIAENWVIQCYERAIFTTDGLHTVPTLAALLKQGNARRRSIGWPLRVAIVLIIAVTVCLGLLWLQRDALVRSIVQQMPLSLEQEIGDTLWDAVRAKEVIIDSNAKYRRQVETVTKRLIATLPKNSEYSFAFHIAEQDGVVNAYALPGGHIVIYTGLLKAVQRPEQLAGVLAHEMAHVTERHAVSNLVSRMGLFGLLWSVFGDSSGLLGLATQGTQELMEQRFSRDYEREADLQAWQRLVEAKIDPRGLYQFFTILDRRDGRTAEMSRPLAWLSSHPATAERIDTLLKLEAGLGGQEKFEPLTTE
jgi:beta-barrel assembly-enhancing protease